MNKATDPIFLIHVYSCLFMTGVICLVQILLYPFFSLIEEKSFSVIHQFHMKKITWVVAPVMFLELMTGLWLLYRARNEFFILNLLSILMLWAWTAFVNVPSHNRLKFESRNSIRNLANLNWPRTLIWTARSIGLFILITSGEFG